MQMVSFVLKSGQILPKGEMSDDNTGLVLEKVRTFNSDFISARTSAHGYAEYFHQVLKMFRPSTQPSLHASIYFKSKT